MKIFVRRDLVVQQTVFFFAKKVKLNANSHFYFVWTNNVLHIVFEGTRHGRDFILYFDRFSVFSFSSEEISHPSIFVERIHTHHTHVEWETLNSGFIHRFAASHIDCASELI